MIKKWPTLSQKQLLDLRIMTVHAVERSSPKTGKVHEFYLFDSNHWINVVAVTPDESLIFVKQFRHGNGEITLEVPGGLVDPGEEPITAATRELREETGFTSDPLIEIGMVAPNPAIFNNDCYTFLALNAQLTTIQEFDTTEEIEVVTFPFTQVMEMVHSREITHSLTLNALFWYQTWKMQNGKQ